MIVEEKSFNILTTSRLSTCYTEKQVSHHGLVGDVLEPGSNKQSSSKKVGWWGYQMLRAFTSIHDNILSSGHRYFKDLEIGKEQCSLPFVGNKVILKINHMIQKTLLHVWTWHDMSRFCIGCMVILYPKNYWICRWLNNSYNINYLKIPPKHPDYCPDQTYPVIIQ